MNRGQTKLPRRHCWLASPLAFTHTTAEAAEMEDTGEMVQCPFIPHTEGGGCVLGLCDCECAAQEGCKAHGCGHSVQFGFEVRMTSGTKSAHSKTLN